MTSYLYEFSKRNISCVYLQFTFFREHGLCCLVSLSQCHQPGQEQWVLGISLLSEPYLPTAFHLQFSDLSILRQTQLVFIEPCRLSKGMWHQSGRLPATGTSSLGTRNILVLGIASRTASYNTHFRPPTGYGLGPRHGGRSCGLTGGSRPAACEGASLTMVGDSTISALEKLPGLQVKTGRVALSLAPGKAAVTIQKM